MVPFPRGSLTWSGLTLLFVAAACASSEPEVDPPPSLAVILVVDQLTPDLLERYDELWSGGFRRLFDRGYAFEDTVHDHAVTFTSPGHASPTTGVVPARHGIVANSWRELRDEEWVSVSSVADPETELVGGSGAGSSPRNLLVEGLPDWILEHHEDARVVSLSGKSTAGVLMAGGTGGDEEGRAHAYWFSDADRGFVTSTHYRAELPEWVAGFNEEAALTFAGDGCWESRVPAEHVSRARRDTVDYEADGIHTHFPHCEADAPYRDVGHFIAQTPALDAATLALASTAVGELQLGGGDAPDYLALALSATDRVGHTFGPYSLEQLDNLMRLDEALGRFFEDLDRQVGPDRYVVALTSDHGVLPLPEYLEERGAYGLRLTSELDDAMERAAHEVGSDPQMPGEGGPDRDSVEFRARLADALEEVEWVEAAMPLEVLAGGEPVDSFTALYRRSFHPERLTSRVAEHGVEVRLREGTLVRSSGTTHGAPYLHDRHVPLLFYSSAVTPARSGDPARTVDLAPTVASILEIPVPAGLDGQDLLP